MPRLAVVDDDPTMLDLIAEVVAERDWGVLRIPECQTVTAVARQEQPDAILFELGSGMLQTRWDLLRKLTTEPATAAIPVVLWSSHPGLPEAQHDWLDMQTMPILSKPFELDDLFDHLDRILMQPATPRRVVG